MPRGTGQAVLDSFEIFICAFVQIGQCRCDLQDHGKSRGKVRFFYTDFFLDFVETSSRKIGTQSS